MNYKILIPGIFAIALFSSCGANETKTKNDPALSGTDRVAVRQEFKKYFDSCGVVGAIAIYDKQQNKWILSDTVETHYATLPASSFKIINLLIALETKTIADENEVVKWVGSIDTAKYGYRPDIYKDMSAKEAFQLSAGWVYIELAKKIGRANYKKYLSKCNYGNSDLSQQDVDFWNFGHFAISPIDQVVFLRNFYDYKLSFSKRNIDIVKQVMIVEQNEAYTISAKTGWTRENNTNTGWWVGYLENKKGTYFFATRLLQDRKFNRDDFGDCRKDITKKVLKDLHVID